MNKIKIITDTCSSLKKIDLVNLDVDFVEEPFCLNEVEYTAFTHPLQFPNEFYLSLKQVEKCFTSCVNKQIFLDLFNKYVNLGYDVFYVGISSGLSASYNNAKMAADEINAKYGNRIFVADSLTGSFGVALMVEKAIELKNKGYSADQIFDALHKNALNVYTLFVPSDLKFLNKSGRISKLQAHLGSLLNLIPVIGVDSEGKLKVVSKCLGFKKAIKNLQNLILENGNLGIQNKIYIGHTGKEEEAIALKKFLAENTKAGEIGIGNIDYTMSCGCGPQTLAVFMLGKNN